MGVFLRDPGMDSGTAPFDPRLADAGIDPASLFPQTEWMRQPRKGMFGNSTQPVCVGPKRARFFAINYLPASQMAAAHGADVSMPLGLTGNESDWGASRMARMQNNMVGATPDGRHGVTYSSPASAWQNWGRQWGKRIDGTGNDADLFLQHLAMDNRGVVGAIDNRGPYNTQKKPYGSPDWMPNSRRAIQSARRLLPFWLASGC